MYGWSKGVFQSGPVIIKSAIIFPHQSIYVSKYHKTWYRYNCEYLPGKNHGLLWVTHFKGNPPYTNTPYYVKIAL